MTRAERLHQDMFSFLEDASAAYCKYFSKELEAAAQATCKACVAAGAKNGGSAAKNGGSAATSNGGSAATPSHTCTVSSVGPALVLFHETRNTEVLASDITSNLIERFSAATNKSIRSFPLAYSDVVYVGQRKPEGAATDFSGLRTAVAGFVSHNSVRLPREPGVLYSQLVALNLKFTGQIACASHFVGGILPDLLFRCPERCLACSLQCMHTVSHDEKLHPVYLVCVCVCVCVWECVCVCV
jgi:zinc finger FYVE domain-containing protein 1